MVNDFFSYLDFYIEVRDYWNGGEINAWGFEVIGRYPHISHSFNKF